MFSFTPSDMTRGEFLLIRSRLGISNADLGAALGCNVATIYRWAAGGPISDDNAAALRQMHHQRQQLLRDEIAATDPSNGPHRITLHDDTDALAATDPPPALSLLDAHRAHMTQLTAALDAMQLPYTITTTDEDQS